jgi:hypothetical protein
MVDLRKRIEKLVGASRELSGAGARENDKTASVMFVEARTT